MSLWTNVRIVYDVSKGIPKNKRYFFDEETSFIIWDNLSIDQIFKGFMQDYKRPKLEELGSERGVDITFKADEHCSRELNPINYKSEIIVSTSGMLIITGNLRDCVKDEFVKRLNEFNKYMSNEYGIFIEDGLVKIDGTWIHELYPQYQESYYKEI